MYILNFIVFIFVQLGALYFLCTLILNAPFLVCFLVKKVYISVTLSNKTFLKFKRRRHTDWFFIVHSWLYSPRKSCCNHSLNTVLASMNW